MADCQHGFLPRRPRLSNLLTLEETGTLLRFDDKKSAYGVYSDFALLIMDSYLQNLIHLAWVNSRPMYQTLPAEELNGRK